MTDDDSLVRPSSSDAVRGNRTGPDTNASDMELTILLVDTVYTLFPGAQVKLEEGGFVIRFPISALSEVWEGLGKLSTQSLDSLRELADHFGLSDSRGSHPMDESPRNVIPLSPRRPPKE